MKFSEPSGDDGYALGKVVLYHGIGEAKDRPAFLCRRRFKSAIAALVVRPAMPVRSVSLNNQLRVREGEVGLPSTEKRLVHHEGKAQARKLRMKGFFDAGHLPWEVLFHPGSADLLPHFRPIAAIETRRVQLSFLLLRMVIGRLPYGLPDPLSLTRLLPGVLGLARAIAEWERVGSQLPTGPTENPTAPGAENAYPASGYTVSRLAGDGTEDARPGLLKPTREDPATVTASSALASWARKRAASGGLKTAAAHAANQVKYSLHGERLYQIAYREKQVSCDLRASQVALTQRRIEENRSLLDALP